MNAGSDMTAEITKKNIVLQMCLADLNVDHIFGDCRDIVRETLSPVQCRCLLYAIYWPSTNVAI